MHRFLSTLTRAVLIGVLLSPRPYASTLQVGPQRDLKLPSQAAKVAKDGDIVEIDNGTYSGDVAVWLQHRLTLRGSGGRARLEANGNSAEAKAIWVLKGNNVTVENIELSGAAVPDLNGAGIRFEGTHLTLRNCHFHHNQMGILTGANPASDILIEGSEFGDNTVDYRRYGSLGHNIYIGNIHRFTLRNSYIHDANIGHNVKSRAKENYLLYNRITDERNASSYLVDLADGGQGYLIGNLFHQSAQSENNTMVSFAAEHNQTAPNQPLYLVNNTFVNDLPGGVILYNHNVTPALLINNLIAGQAAGVTGPNEQKQTIAETDPHFRSPRNYDYRLANDSAAIDRGIDPGTAADGFSLVPEYQYVHPAQIEARRVKGPLDAGAYEFDGR